MPSESKSPSQKWARRRSVTRSRILDAAAQVLAEKGFQRASLDEIAARAGLTKGAVYSSFATKDDLFLAVLSMRQFRLNPKLKPNMTRKEYFRALAESAVDMLPQAREQAAFMAEFLLYTLTHQDMRQRVAATQGKINRDPSMRPPLDPSEPLAMPMRDMANIVQVLSLGIMVQHMLTPDEVTPDLVRKAFRLLAVEHLP